MEKVEITQERVKPKILKLRSFGETWLGYFYWKLSGHWFEQCESRRWLVGLDDIILCHQLHPSNLWTYALQFLVNYLVPLDSILELFSCKKYHQILCGITLIKLKFLHLKMIYKTNQLFKVYFFLIIFLSGFLYFFVFNFF